MKDSQPDVATWGTIRPCTHHEHDKIIHEYQESDARWKAGGSPFIVFRNATFVIAIMSNDKMRQRQGQEGKRRGRDCQLLWFADFLRRGESSSKFFSEDAHSPSVFCLRGGMQKPLQNDHLRGRVIREDLRSRFTIKAEQK